MGILFLRFGGASTLLDGVRTFLHLNSETTIINNVRKINFFTPITKSKHLSNSF